MNFLNNLSLFKRMLMAIVIILVLFLIFSYFIINRISYLNGFTIKITEHPYQVSASAIEASKNVVKIHRDMQQIMLSSNKVELNQLINEINATEKEVYKDLDIVREQILGEKGKKIEQQVRTLFNEWKPIRDEAIKLIIKDKAREAIELTSTKGESQANRLETKLTELSQISSNNVKSLNEQSKEILNSSISSIIASIIGITVISIIIALFITMSITKNIALLQNAMLKGTATEEDIKGKNEISDMASVYNKLINKLIEQDWRKTNLARLSSMMQGQRDLVLLTKELLSELANITNAQHCVFYIMNDSNNEKHLKLLASYAYKERKNLSNKFKPGEGLVGQCALEKQRILITNVPEDYIQISSGLGEARPFNIVVLPVTFEKEIKAVIELASFSDFNDNTLEFLEQFTENIGITINTIEANTRTEDLLRKTQTQAEELKIQQEELKTVNEELEVQQEELKAANEELQVQQEELKTANEELEEKAYILDEQKKHIEVKSRDIEKSKVILEQKAQELALASKYKSEFLANMSHEIRTPLNSIMILSDMLSENKENNLTSKQIEFAETIHTSGSELLTLINEVLDLSKIESGTMNIEVSDITFKNLKDWSERGFQQIANSKKLEFSINLNENLPEYINTDHNRLQQILKNLLSNAFKFTEHGKVDFNIDVATKGWNIANETLNKVNQVIAFSVVDSGIGIPENKHNIIFEAFEQSDGTTSRKYGGTGLGLSISRELAKLLGGEIQVKSTVGEGSTFTLYLPVKYNPQEILSKREDQIIQEAKHTTSEHISILSKHNIASEEISLTLPAGIEDDRESIQPDDRVILIVEDDVRFAKIVLEHVREKGFKGLVALQGNAAIHLANLYKPDAITLDIQLPDMDGWTILDMLKHQSSTKHIPVNIISIEDEIHRGMKMGAFDYLMKPATSDRLYEAISKIRNYIEKPIKKLLVVEDNDIQRNSIVELIGNSDVKTTAVGTATEAINLLKEETFDCMILDLKLPDMSGFELLERISKELNITSLPIIIYTGKEISKKEETQLKQIAETIIIKDIKSSERLLAETSLFLHRVEENLPSHKRQIIEQLYNKDPILMGKKVLIVDDDIRNIFAVTSLLETFEMKVIHAENGKESLEILEKTPDIDVILMDIMMPEMDGYETIQIIRKIQNFNKTPIIALTAKAMKGDRQKCIMAGASDYITKPIDSKKLTSLLRVWLYK
ncbi:MAG: response regulator [Cyanobacteriota bacterium]